MSKFVTGSLKITVKSRVSRVVGPVVLGTILDTFGAALIASANTKMSRRFPELLRGKVPAPGSKSTVVE